MTVKEKIESCKTVLDELKDMVIIEHERIGTLAIGMDGDEIDYCEIIKTPEDLQFIIDKEIEYREENKNDN